MKHLLPFLLLTTGYLLFAISAHAIVTTNQTIVREAWYCNGNDVWHYRTGDLSAPNVNEFAFACGNQICAPQPPPDPIYEQDVTCYDPASLPQNGTGTIMHLPKPVSTQGDPEVIGIGADKTCWDKIDNNHVENTLRVGGELLNCKVTDGQTEQEACGCITRHVRTCHRKPDGEEICNCNQTQDCKNADWPNGTTDECGEVTGVNPYDNKRCFKTITCDTHSIGILDAPLITGDDNCRNNIKYQVVAPGSNTQTTSTTCYDGPHTPVSGVPTSGIVDNSTLNVKTDADNLALGTLPDNLCQQQLKTCLQTPVNAGLIEQNSFNITSLLCKAASIFQNVQIFGPLRGVASVCDQQVFVADRNTKCFTEESKCLGLSDLVPNTNKAQTQDCVMTDYENKHKKTEGNKNVTDISQNLGGSNGVFGSYLPTGVTCPLDPSQNLTTQDYLLHDDRNPDLRAQQATNLIANFPYATGCPTPGSTNGAPANVQACKDVCSSTLDQDLAACNSKSGHDKDNCVNDAAQKKDKCFKNNCGVG